jgi:hypothetical protein
MIASIPGCAGVPDPASVPHILPGQAMVFIASDSFLTQPGRAYSRRWRLMKNWRPPIP